MSRPETHSSPPEPAHLTGLAALMGEAVDFSVRHVNSGGLPFVGVVVDQHGYAFQHGVNQVQQSGDPTAHAEIVAMRAALRQLSRTDLKDLYLLATGEPCGLCYRFALEHLIERIYVAVESDEVARWGFDYRSSYRDFDVDRAQLAELIVPLPVPNGLEPFERYLSIGQSGRHALTHRPGSRKGLS